jgi:hypothetical protein
MRHPLLGVLVVVALFVAMSGCSSSDPTTSDEYTALEQELTQTNQELAQAETQLSDTAAERDALQAELASDNASGVSQDVGRGPVPDDVVALIEQWKQATASSMVDLYTPTGFHLYGTQRYTGEAIGPHLVNPSVDHEELTPLLLVADELGRYVVTQGVENTVGPVKAASGISWEIVDDLEGRLKIAQSAWFKMTG